MSIVYIYIYVYSWPRMRRANSSARLSPRASKQLVLLLLSCDIHTHTPARKNIYNLPAVLFCYTNLFYKLAWAWAWV